MNTQSGFTIAELLIATVLVVGGGFFMFTQWQYAAKSDRDETRKTSINAVDSYLKEVYLPQHKSFPVVLDEKALSGLDSEFLRDPAGRVVGDAQSDFRYEASQCDGVNCQHYTLRADLEKEADFIRQAQVK